MALLHHGLVLVLVACAIWNLTNAASLELSSGMYFFLALLIGVIDFIVRKNFEILQKVTLNKCEGIIGPNFCMVG